MNPFEMVVIIIAIITVGKIVQGRYRHGAAAQPIAPPEDTLRLRDEVRMLRERIQVLERVITDTHGSADLNRQIEQLRDR